MSSLTRNIRRADFPRGVRALGAGLALMLASGAALAGGAQQFVFTAYTDAAGGADVVAGRYRAALAELKSGQPTLDSNPSAADSNRCVAYTMTLQLEKASAACDAAVRAARQQRNEQTAMWAWSPATDDEYLAVAYANRAVMHWLSHDEAAASDDLAKARKLSPAALFVARNVVALKMHGAVAEAKAHGQVAQAAALAPKS